MYVQFSQGHDECSLSTMVYNYVAEGVKLPTGPFYAANA